MVAGRDSPGRPLGDCGLDEYRAVGSRSRRAQHRCAEGYRARQDADRRRRPRRHALPRTRFRKRAAAVRWRRWRPCPACGWSTTKPVSFPKPSRSSGRRSGTWSGSRWAAARHCRPARAVDGGGPRGARRRRGRRPDGPGARRAAAFRNAAVLLLDQIGKLKDGKITISDTEVGLSGMARDLGGREAIAAALKNLPEGFSVAANEIKAPPYIFQAYKDPVAVTLTLTGYVPDNNVHAALVAAAGAQILQREGRRQSQGQRRRAAGFAGAVMPALGALSRLSTGTLVVSDREVKLSGDAFYDAAAAQIRAGLGKDVPQGWQFKADISVKPAAAPVDATVCQQLFSELLGKGKIRFESGRATHRSGFRRAARPADRDRAALSDRQYRDRRPYRCRRRGRVQPGAVGKARAGGGRIIWSRPACPPTASRRSAMAARSRSPPTIPTKARRRTAASSSW